ncbi:hypothetical protein RF11_12309 [Thelohanellus kitauei]|uniref:Cathepsin propeptide inhibitor domain-containing protein n=1 Tax=Thelohanellus kitauei TaxID=669202 RepID=A0A0C2J528_THEKT|nr:hypothetical protein RF11_12309 [Thelohanellus kitauei]
MLKVAVLLLVFTRTDSVITGGWTDWHRVEDKEKDMLQEIKASFRNKTSGLKHYDTRHADLLQKASYDNIRFQTQLVAGINYRFKKCKESFHVRSFNIGKAKI